MKTTTLRCILLCTMCLALQQVYNQELDENTHTELYDDYDSENERYLFADDDRHNNGPNENNVTNNPTIFGFSRAPSISPTVITLSPSPTVRPTFSSAPSMTPSFSSVPSISPTTTISPSISPSISSPPSSMPSLDACKAYDGVFGNVNSVNKIRVSFNYGIETDMTIQNTLSSQIFNVEAELLSLLIQQLILRCQSSETDLTIAAGTLSDTDASSIVNTNVPSQAPTESILGMTSRPVDLPSGGKCLSSFQEGDCNIVKGKMDLYLAPNASATDTRILFQRAVKSIMDAGLLNDCHPAIIRVIWVDLSSEIVEQNENNNLDDDATEIDPISVGSMTTWMFIAGSVVFVMVVGVVTRYRYYRVKGGKYDKEDDTESYIDVLTQNGSVPTEIRRASLRSEIPIEPITVEQVPSVKSSRSSESSFHGFSWWDDASESPQSNDEENVRTSISPRQQKIAEIRARLKSLESDIGSYFSNSNASA